MLAAAQAGELSDVGSQADVVQPMDRTNSTPTTLALYYPQHLPEPEPLPTVDLADNWWHRRVHVDSRGRTWCQGMLARQREGNKHVVLRHPKSHKQYAVCTCAQ